MTEPLTRTTAAEAKPSGPAEAASGYHAAVVERRWQRYWAEHRTFEARDDGSRERRYVLDMFAYPSGDLHMGHAEAYAMADVIARFDRLNGFDVLHPIGWDSFGLPAENAAIRRGTHPAEWTYANIDTQASSLRRYGLSVDWTRRLHTSDEDYYRWTQWLFLRFYERGLAYRKDSSVTWCPTDQTVLANEQAVGGLCERCGTVVTKRKLNQWFFKITDYADQLLDDLEQLRDGWPERVLTMQRNWIGRSVGAYVDFRVVGDHLPDPVPVSVFTTRPDTLYGATFFVVAPETELADRLCAPAQRAAFEAYVEQTERASEIERQSTDRPKTGVPLGVQAINPVNGERLPVYAADYVLADYGTGALMAVPAHDQRDLDFAIAHGLPVRTVVDTGAPDPAVTHVPAPGDGRYVNSGELDGLSERATAVAMIIERLTAEGTGRAAVTYRLRDWLLSRQRFWGCPIPIVHCDRCGEAAVPDDQLPVRLPHLTGADLAAGPGPASGRLPRDGVPPGDQAGDTSPLAAATDWVNVACPQCGGPARRDTDTMDTFVDSSWYFYRYCSPGFADGPFDPVAVRRWMPVAQYVGGGEHAILHLLYLRFFTKVLRDMGLVDFDEPMLRLLNQGQVINRGKAMSKSLGNGVDLAALLDEFGADAVRTTVIFAGPPSDDLDWADVSPGATLRFLQRAWRVAAEVTSAPGVDPAEGDPAVRRTTHRHLAEVTELVQAQKFNVAVARVMELVNATRKAIDAGPGPADPAVREAAETITIMLSLFAPHVSEQMWERLGHQPSVADATWPAVQADLLVAESVTCVVQVAGTVRAKITVAPDVTEQTLTELALADPAVQRWLAGREVRTIIVRVPRLVSLVV